MQSAGVSQQLYKLHPYYYNCNNRDMMATFIIDPTHNPLFSDATSQLEDITCRMCFKLHNHRIMILGMVSMNSRGLEQLMVSWLTSIAKAVKTL